MPATLRYRPASRGQKMVSRNPVNPGFRRVIRLGYVASSRRRPSGQAENDLAMR